MGRGEIHDANSSSLLSLRRRSIGSTEKLILRRFDETLNELTWGYSPSTELFLLHRDNDLPAQIRAGNDGVKCNRLPNLSVLKPQEVIERNGFLNLDWYQNGKRYRESGPLSLGVSRYSPRSTNLILRCEWAIVHQDISERPLLPHKILYQSHTGKPYFQLFAFTHDGEDYVFSMTWDHSTRFQRKNSDGEFHYVIPREIPEAVLESVPDKFVDRLLREGTSPRRILESIEALDFKTE